MTLLELLVKELPGLGGWPIGCGVISTNSKLDVIGHGYDDVTESTKSIVININADEAGIVIKQSYEEAIAAQHPVWNGEGLPPVGCECEYETIKDNWRKCRVMYLGEKCNIVRTDEWGEVSCGLSVKFRPIRTEAERKREDEIAEMASTPKPCGHAIYDICAQLYDAGYRKAGVTDDHMG